MKIYRSIEDYDEDKRSVVTIGTFDGIHLGHQEILSRLIKSSKNKDLNSVVLTFFPHPRIILNKYNEVKMIDTLDEKIIHLNEIGIDSLIIHPFDRNFSLLSANQFIKDFLVDKLKIKHIIIGYDHRFGKGREASVTDLKNYANDYDFTVEEIKAQEIEKITVSSTKIRNSINQGDIKTTEKYLGRYFNLTGKVVKGDGLGKKINYPTANIFIEETYKIIPKDGVYLVETIIKDKLFNGMMNIGHRPTIGTKNKSIEVHLFNFNEDIYGQVISIKMISKIRDEKKFSSIQALKEQLVKDENYCLKLINK
ncbi:MAG: bifunctional riboflavin kinase/FAD synthetase [Candidatus Marisimplicoccus sp.]|jgi:riboflavin kinase/FMN adenylyltransferase|nr:riboflavin biosynthesis protein RibF [Flavobacteriaceae bacterium]RZO99948.1 MAG: bifunctional riboflavin kinase/FAD synthetase [Flavobacteriales bacterium]|tara:strand:- start:5875 stop:6801 length:927 start_codon:yes stop_codon:yes gene_type:complete